MRDREKTRRKILEAVGQLLSRDGFRDVGVNAIAREAGVDKVLIYRYFGGLRGLLEAFAREADFWPAAEDLMPPADQAQDLSTPELAKSMIARFGQALRRRPMTQEIMRWELFEENELTDALAEYRERHSLELLKQIDAPPELDVPAIAAVLGAAQSYLILRAKTAKVYNGVDLRSEKGWKRIDRALGLLIERTLGQPSDRHAENQDGSSTG